jgi:hypothetical protein
MAAVQGGPPAQLQRPSVAQLSVVSASQTRHTPPPAPQAAALGEVMHTPLLQHPMQASQPDIGAARVTVTAFSRPFTTTTRAAPWPTSAPAERPCTWISRLCWSSASASSTRTLELLGSSAPAVSGRSTGPNTPASPSNPVYWS